jgi:hypothetical protein
LFFYYHILSFIKLKRKEKQMHHKSKKSISGWSKRCAVITVAIALILAVAASAPNTAQAQYDPSKIKGIKWMRGQLHIHSNWVPVDEMAKWYKYHGYNFIAFADINTAHMGDGLNSIYGSPKFLVLPGIEFGIMNDEGKYFDTCGFGGNMLKAQAAWKPVKADFRKTRNPAKVLDTEARLIRAAGGIPYASHPNFGWAWGAEDLLKTDPKLVRHFELRNGEHGMNDLGGGGKPSTEEIWDTVLSTGRQLYGHAVDDCHHLYDLGQQHFFHATSVENSPGHRIQAKALPGRTSIFVRVKELTVEAIMKAIESGDFYSALHLVNLPIQILAYDVDKNGIQLALPKRNLDKGNHGPGVNITVFRTYFIGKDGKVLKIDESFTPSYKFTGDELYVRVRVEDSDGGMAWMQPVFVSDLR